MMSVILKKKFVNQKQFTKPFFKMTDIIKPTQDIRAYKYFTLPNKFRCLLISDPEADKSAAAIDVRVGCSLDPKPLYGTAHFLEHMLF
jgi:insulysin